MIINLFYNLFLADGLVMMHPILYGVRFMTMFGIFVSISYGFSVFPMVFLYRP